MFGALGQDSVHCGFEGVGIGVHLFLVFCSKPLVDFVPVLGVLGFVGFLFPIGDVALDEFSPYFGVGAAELGGGFFEYSLFDVLVSLAGL